MTTIPKYRIAPYGTCKFVIEILSLNGEWNIAETSGSGPINSGLNLDEYSPVEYATQAEAKKRIDVGIAAMISDKQALQFKESAERAWAEKNPPIQYP